MYMFCLRGIIEACRPNTSHACVSSLLPAIVCLPHCVMLVACVLHDSCACSIKQTRCICDITSLFLQGYAANGCMAHIIICNICSVRDTSLSGFHKGSSSRSAPSPDGHFPHEHHKSRQLARSSISGGRPCEFGAQQCLACKLSSECCHSPHTVQTLSFRTTLAICSQVASLCLLAML